MLLDCLKSSRWIVAPLAAGTFAALPGSQMAAFIRVLLWMAVVVAPGGVLLLPLLAADALRQRSKAPGATHAEPV